MHMYQLSVTEEFHLDGQVGHIIRVDESADLDTMVDFFDVHRETIKNYAQHALFVLLAFSKVPTSNAEHSLQKDSWFPIRPRTEFSEAASNWHAHQAVAIFKPAQPGITVPTAVTTIQSKARAKQICGISKADFTTPHQAIAFNQHVEMFTTDSIDVPGHMLITPEGVEHCKLPVLPDFKGGGGVLHRRGVNFVV